MARDTNDDLVRNGQALLLQRRAEYKRNTGERDDASRPVTRPSVGGAGELRANADLNTANCGPWPANAVEAVAAGRQWGSPGETIAIRQWLARQEKRGGDAVDYRALADEARERIEASAKESDGEDNECADIQEVRHYPDLGLAAKERGLSAHYQVWLWAHLLDERAHGGFRRGVLESVEELRAAITGDDSPTRLFGWRRLRQILNEGEAAGFWARDDQGRLWVSGEKKLKTVLDVSKLTGYPVSLSLDILTLKRQAFNAHLSASFKSARPKGIFMSQKKERELTGVPERSQRRYNKIAGVKQGRRTTAAAEKATVINKQERAWERGNNLFELHDKKGKQGRPGETYLAWRLPPKRYGPHPCEQARGRQKKINKSTADLVITEALGNGRGGIERRFCDDPKTAYKAVHKQGGDVYFKATNVSTNVDVYYVVTL